MEQDLRLNWPNLVQEAIKRRKQQRLTQMQVSVLAGVSKPTVNAFEQGYTTITVKNAMKILELMGLI